MTAIASPAQLRMSFLRYALFTVPATLLLGTLSGVAAQSGYGNPWFDALQKPSFMPPGWAFPVAWTILYILLGLSLAMILHARGARGRGLPVTLFLIQMALNYAWSPAFFAFHRVGLAFGLIVGMILLTLLCAFLFRRIRKAAALLLIPYLAWLCFAGALTWQIRALNPDYLAQPGASADIAL